MPGEEIDPSQLSTSQQEALQTYISVTSQEASEAIPLLQRSEWNVQIAVTKFFDGEGPDPLQAARDALDNQPPPRQGRIVENLMESDINFARSSLLSATSGSMEPAPRIPTRPTDQPPFQPPFLLAILFSPFNILYRLLSGSFRIFGTLLPFIPRLLNAVASPALQSIRNDTSGRRPLGPKDTAIRFIREFEEEYGPNSLPFLENGYNMALEKAHHDLKFLLIVLLSPEHDDINNWVRGTLLDPEVVSYINDPRNELLLWGGNVQDSEAYQVANSLRCTKFPFAAVIVHTPNISSTAMSIVTRIPGPTSSAEFLAKLRTCVNQNREPLDRVRSQRAEQQAARTLREQQDSAYERSLARDRERARQRREAEAERQRLEREAAEKRAAEEKYARDLEQWKRWRAQSIPEEPPDSEKDAVRISIRLASGDRVVRRFAGNTTMEELYAFVECYDVLHGGGNEDNDSEVVEKSSHQVSEPEGFEHKYNFRLVSPMPRTVFELDAGGTVRERIGRGGNLVVETLDDDEDEDEQEN
ncbi:hypothetical protein VTO42DRAFT_9065 [Malbranchea cinnamomea]